MVRIKNRYFLVNILYPEASSSTTQDPSQPLPDVVKFRKPTPTEVTAQLLLREVREQIGLLYGDYGAGVSGGSLAIKYFSPATSTFILRCSRAHFRLVWAVLSLITHLPLPYTSAVRSECVMRVVKVSGTIKKVEEEIIRRARCDILRAKGEHGGEGGTEALEAMLRKGTGGDDGEEGGGVVSDEDDVMLDSDDD